MWAKREAGMGAQFFDFRLGIDFYEPATFEVGHQSNQFSFIVHVIGKGTVIHQFQQDLITGGQTKYVVTSFQGCQIWQFIWRAGIGDFLQPFKNQNRNKAIGIGT